MARRSACATSLRRRASVQDVERASRRVPEFLHDVGVDHRRLHIRVAEVLLDLADVDAIPQQVCGEAVPQGVHRHGLWMRAADAAALTAFCTTESLMW